ncbi:MAG: hypothetical protein ACI4OZ_03025 [Akkermansia sp.]
MKDYKEIIRQKLVRFLVTDWQAKACTLLIAIVIWGTVYCVTRDEKKVSRFALPTLHEK